MKSINYKTFLSLGLFFVLSIFFVEGSAQKNAVCPGTVSCTERHDNLNCQPPIQAEGWTILYPPGFCELNGTYKLQQGVSKAQGNTCTYQLQGTGSGKDPCRYFSMTAWGL